MPTSWAQPTRPGPALRHHDRADEPPQPSPLSDSRSMASRPAPQAPRRRGAEAARQQHPPARHRAAGHVARARGGTPAGVLPGSRPQPGRRLASPAANEGRAGDRSMPPGRGASEIHGQVTGLLEQLGARASLKPPRRVQPHQSHRQHLNGYAWVGAHLCRIERSTSRARRVQPKSTAFCRRGKELLPPIHRRIDGLSPNRSSTGTPPSAPEFPRQSLTQREQWPIHWFGLVAESS